MVKFLKEKTDLTRISSVLSLFTLVAFHWPFFRLVLGNIEGGFNGVLITGGLGVLMFALNFLVYYLVLFLGRFVGKCILAFTFIGNAISLYFINTYQVLITDKMMGNVFNTRYSEASGFFSWSAVWYLLFLGVVPCIYIFARRFDYGSWKRFFARTGIALGFLWPSRWSICRTGRGSTATRPSSAAWSCRGRIRSTPYATIIP